MRPPQRVIGRGVVELVFVERRDVHVAALVLGMAAAARLDLDASVQALVPRDVLRHGLVAIEAEPVLRALVEAHVAIGAFALELRVAGDDLAGHERAFELRACRSGQGA